jgi:hypothetical protein
MQLSTRQHYHAEFAAMHAGRQRPRLLSLRPSGDTILMLLADADNSLTLIRLTQLDQSELDSLSADDRARAKSAVLTLSGGRLDAA